MIVFAVGLGGAVSLRDVRFAPENRFDPVGLRLLVELEGAKHVSMIGDRD